MKRPFDWLEDDLRQDALATLDAPMPRGREPLGYRTPPKHLDQATVDGKPHLVFAAYYPYPSVIKRAIPLAATGRFHLTFLGLCIREDYEILRFFDQAYEADDYAHMHALFGGCRAHAVHATIQPNILGVLAADHAANYRLVLDIVDSQLYQEHGAAHPAARTEAAILARCAFLAHKLPPDGAAALQKAYGTRVPQALLHSLPWPPIFQEVKAPAPAPWRIAYAGGVMPYHIALARGFGHHVFDPVIASLAGAGCGLTFFVNQNARNMFWHEHQRYIDMEKDFPNFRFVKGLPFHRITAELCNHHFGLMYDNLDKTAFNTDHFRYNMSSKLFTYLEAGLPILAHDRFDYIAGIIAEHGLGLVYDLGDLTSIPRLMDRADYPALCANVRRFRDDNPLDSTLPGLLEAFGAAHA